MDPVESAGDESLALSYRTLDVRFTGSGAEYFRIWIVNLLLLIVTLGFYWPWAKVRRLRYFMQNTLVGGDPLDFLGDPKQMFKGWALVFVLYAMYNVASKSSSLASLVALVALGSLWPALWRSSMRFRMGNTSWRGLRLKFTGSTADAYRALWPVALAVLPVLVVGSLMPDEPDTEPSVWVLTSLGASVFFGLALLPWLFWRMKAYQHRHYALAHLQTDFRATVRSFYGLAIKQLGLMLLLVLVVVTLIWAVFALANKPQAASEIAASATLLWILPLLLVGLVIGSFFIGMGPWWDTRLQNLVWTKTGNAQLRFISRLRFRDMLWLTVKNGVLMVLTLGFYWPFAKVAMARLRLEAVSIRTVIDLEELVEAELDKPQEAAGDAAGDFFGMDVGL